MEEYSEKSLFVVGEDQRNFAAYFSQISENGQIGFVKDKGDDTGQYYPTYLYAKDSKYGDGAWSDKTVLSDNICLAGGPLADEVKHVFFQPTQGTTEDIFGGNPYIKKGTDLESILIKLLTKEIWPKPTVTPATFTLTNNAPTITNYTNKWVGDSVNITITRKDPTVNSAKPKITNLSYGFAYGTNYALKSTNTTYEGTSSSTMKTGGAGICYYTTDGSTWKNFNKASEDIQYTVKYGTNTITAYQNYAKANKIASAIPSLMPLSNVKHVYSQVTADTTYSIAAVNVTEYTQSSKSSNASETFTGVYKLNYGVGNKFSDISNVTYAIGSTAGKREFELSFTGSATACKCVAFPASFANPKVQIMTTGWTDNNDYTIKTDDSYTNCGVKYKFLIYNSPNKNNQQLKLTFTNSF